MFDKGGIKVFDFEAELLKENNRYIARQARAYQRRIGAPEHVYEDLYQEAVLAFLKTSRRWQFEATRLTPLQYKLCYNAMRSAMRGFFWNLNGEKNKNNALTNCPLTFSDITSEESDDVDKLDFLVDTDDYSAVDLKDSIARLTDVERRVLRLLMSGCSEAEVARKLDCSRATVSNTVKRLRMKFAADAA